MHQYGYGRDHDATHHTRPHSQSAPPQLNLNALKPPSMGSRQASSTSVYPPVVEEPEEMEYEESMEKRYRDPYTRSSSSKSVNGPPKLPALPTTSGHKFSNMFHLSTSENPAKYEVRGGGHRGTKDYPHLKASESHTEMEERESLVEKEGEKEWDSVGHSPIHQSHYRQTEDSDDDEGPKSAVTDESFGHVLRVERRPVLDDGLFVSRAGDYWTGREQGGKI